MIKAKRNVTVVVCGLLGACIGIPLAGSAGAASPATPPIGAFTTTGAYSFVSAPKLHPPILTTDAKTRSHKLAPGYFLTANFKDLTSSKPMVGEGGPLILDSRLQPVWFAPIGTNVVAGNLKQQTYNGKPALSWWQGVINNFGVTLSGEVVVVDRHYRTVGTLTGKDGWVISLHDASISGSAVWVTSYKNVPNQDLSSYCRGPGQCGSHTGTVADSAVQKYDLKTGNLLYTWDALNPSGTPNIALSDSATKPSPPTMATPNGTPWDAYHINSVQLVGSHQVLVSMRNTWAVYLIDTNTNKIVWTLGGKHSSFTLPTTAQFHWQHDAQMHPGNVVSVFDDSCCAIVGPGKFGPPNGPSRGLELKLDTTHHTATQAAQYVRAADFNAAFLGSFNLLAGGNVLVGWGSRPYFSEYSKSGKLLLDAVWPTPDLSYRVFLEKWVGKPYYPPHGVVRKRHGKTKVYASWNGATQLVTWKLLAGPNAKHLKVVSTHAKDGFETVISLKRGYKTYRLQALDAKGHVIRSSKLFSKLQPGSNPGNY